MRKKSSLMLFVTTLILAASLVGFLPSSLSLVFDNFDDNVTDPTKWITSVTGTALTILEEQGQLQIALSANAEDAPGQGYFGASYISVCQLQGDFDLQVDYLLLDWPSNNGARVALSLDSNQSPPREYNAARVSFGNADFPEEPRDAYFFGDVDTVTEIVATDHLSGTLRIQRSDSLLIGYYRNGESWVALDTMTVTPANLHFGVSAWSQSYAFAKQKTTVAFDNLTILQGEIICPGATTPTLIATAAATETASATPALTRTPEISHSYLPVALQQPTPTPTVTPTASSTPTPTRTPTPTAVARPLLQDGYYFAEFSDGEEGSMSFRVSGNGTKAFSGSFLINKQSPYCNPVGYVFYDTVAIKNGAFQFFADAGSLAIIAEIKCVSVSPTSASCTATHFRSAAGQFGFCGVAAGIASRR